MLGATPAGLTSAEQAHATLQSLAALSQVTGPPPSAVPTDGAVANLAPFSQLAAGAMHMPLASVPLGALGAPSAAAPPPAPAPQMMMPPQQQMMPPGAAQMGYYPVPFGQAQQLAMQQQQQQVQQLQLQAQQLVQLQQLQQLQQQMMPQHNPMMHAPFPGMIPGAGAMIPGMIPGFPGGPGAMMGALAAQATFDPMQPINPQDQFYSSGERKRSRSACVACHERKLRCGARRRRRPCAPKTPPPEPAIGSQLNCPEKCPESPLAPLPLLTVMLLGGSCQLCVAKGRQCIPRVEKKRGRPRTGMAETAALADQVRADDDADQPVSGVAAPADAPADATAAVDAPSAVPVAPAVVIATAPPGAEAAADAHIAAAAVAAGTMRFGTSMPLAALGGGPHGGPISPALRADFAETWNQAVVAGSAASTGSDQETVPPAPAQPYAAAPVVAAPVAAAPVVAAPVVARPAPSHGCSPLNPAALLAVPATAPAPPPAAAPFTQTELLAVPASAPVVGDVPVAPAAFVPGAALPSGVPGGAPTRITTGTAAPQLNFPTPGVAELAATADGGAYVSHFMTDAPTAPLPAATAEAPPPPALAALADDELAVAPLSALGGGPPPPFDAILAVPAAAPDAADAAAAVAAGGAGDGATPA